MVPQLFRQAPGGRCRVDSRAGANYIEGHLYQKLEDNVTWPPEPVKHGTMQMLGGTSRTSVQPQSSVQNGYARVLTHRKKERGKRYDGRCAEPQPQPEGEGLLVSGHILPE